MKLLLDTHVLIWYLADDPKLPFAIRDLIIEPPGLFHSIHNLPRTEVPG